MNLEYGLKEYPEEIDFYNEQDISSDVNICQFFELMDRIGVSDYIDDKSEWIDLFDISNSSLAGLQSIIDIYK